MRATIWLLAPALLVAGCYDWRAGVSQAAAIEHGCPVGQVLIVSDNGDGYARLVELEVCGDRRVYHDVGGRNGYVWVDTTPGTSGGEAPADDRRGRIASDVGPAPADAPAPVAAAVRASIDAARGGVLACAAADRAAVVASHAPGDDRVRFALRGDDSGSVRGCLDAAIGAVFADPSQPAWELLHPVAP